MTYPTMSRLQKIILLITNTVEDKLTEKAIQLNRRI